MNSSRFAIATHVLVALEYLRREGQTSVPSRGLAKSVGTNPAFLRELIQRLKKAKLVTATEGRWGGVRIAKDANRITLRTVYSVVEPRPAVKENPRRIYKACPVSCAMKGLLRPVVDEVDSAMLGVLEKTKISDLTNSISPRNILDGNKT